MVQKFTNTRYHIFRAQYNIVHMHCAMMTQKLWNRNAAQLT